MKFIYTCLVLFIACTVFNTGHAAESFCPKGSNPSANVIWCDSFEDEDLGTGGTVGENYYDFSPGSDPQNMVRTSSESILGSYALKNHWNSKF